MSGITDLQRELLDFKTQVEADIDIMRQELGSQKFRIDNMEDRLTDVGTVIGDFRIQIDQALNNLGSMHGDSHIRITRRGDGSAQIGLAGTRWKFELLDHFTLNVGDGAVLFDAAYNTWSSAKLDFTGKAAGTYYIYTTISSGTVTLNISAVDTRPNIRPDTVIIGEVIMTSTGILSWDQYYWADATTTIIPDADLLAAEQPAWPTYTLQFSAVDGRETIYKVEDTTLNNANKAWSAAAPNYGLMLFNKSALQGRVEWTGFDTDFSATQKSICRSTGDGGKTADLADLIQIYWMDKANPTTPAAAETTEFCYRTTRWGETRFGTLNFAGIAGHISHDDTTGAGDSTVHDPHNDGRYWMQGDDTGTCFSAGIGNTALGVRIIDLNDTLLKEDSVDNYESVDWTARTLSRWDGVSAIETVINWNLAFWHITFGANDFWNPTTGMKVGNGVYALKGAAAQAGYFEDGVKTVSLANVAGDYALEANGSGLQVALCAGTYAVYALTGRINSVEGYDFASTPGVSLASRLGGGIDIGSTHEIDAQDLLPTDKILVRR